MIAVESDVAIVAGLISIVGGIGVLFIKFYGMVSNFAKLELKVDTLWDFLMRRSLAYGLDNGVLTMNSPIKATKTMDELLEPMAKELGDFYRDEGHKLDPRTLFIETERRFGNKLMKEICIPYKMHQGAIVMAALDVAKKRGTN